MLTDQAALRIAPKDAGLDDSMPNDSRHRTSGIGGQEQARADAVAAVEELIFGPFRLVPARKLLLEADRPCKLGSRALDLLTVLAGRAGEVVTREELIAQVWPGTFVEDNNLRVQMAALRRVLGDGRDGRNYIRNIAGQGYRFVADVRRHGTATDAVPPGAAAARHSLTRIVGRDTALAALAADMRAHRLVTVCGPGGIGKTTVATALADGLVPGLADQACLVELASLADPALVASAVASSLGLPVLSQDPLPALVAWLRDRRLLLVLDNCEHVIDATALLVEAVLAGAPGIRVLATSREPLRARGEWVMRLPALDVPPAGIALTAAAAMAFPAVQLFVDRAAAAGLGSFALTDADAPLAAEICRRLDGMPLALELAAARVDGLGLARIASGLDDRLRLLTRGRRTALGRHQTLRAALDWSYDILSERDQVVFERLALFAGGFDLDAAIAVASCPRIDGPEVAEAVFDLTAKSLLAFDAGGEVVRYRLLELTGAYALDKLRARDGFAAAAARHAAHVLAVLGRAERDVAALSRADWLAVYGPQVDDVRAAIGQARSADDAAAIALTAAAVPLWTELALFDECRKAAGQALADRAAIMRNPSAEMQLCLALGLAMMMTHAGALGDILAAFDRALMLARALDDADYQARILWATWLGQVHAGRHRVALGLAHDLARAAAGTADAAVADRLIGDSLHCLGDQPAARDHLERAVVRLAGPQARSQLVRFYFDQQVMAQATLAHVLWLQGFPDRAMRMAEAAAARARGLDHANSCCAALGYATCRIALLTGDLDAAARAIDELFDLSRRHAIDIWSDWANCFHAGLLARRGALASGLDVMRSTLARYAEPRFLYFFAGLADVAEMLGAAGEGGWALGVIEDTIRRVGQSDERWCVPEFLRIRGQLMAQAGTGSSGEAEGLLVQAIAMARDQGALSWELRAATSLARIRADQGRTAEARDLLAPVHARFTEGFDTADVKRAATLLAALRSA